MLLEPKQIEPGWARRWPREAAALVGQNFHLWFALMLGATALAVGLTYLPASLLTLLVLAVFTFKLSQEFAMAAEHAPVGLAQVSSMAAAAARATGPEIQRNPFLLFLLTGLAALDVARRAGLLGVVAVPAATATAAATGMPSLAELVFYWKPLASAHVLYSFGVLVAFRPVIGGLLVYPLQRMHGLDFEQAERLVTQGARRNVKVMLAGDAVLFFGTLVLMLLLPVALPFLLCLGPALSYVACREMFGTGSPLHQKQTQSAFKPVLES